MSAETLRRAASLMRERAEVVAPGPWEARPGGGVWTWGEDGFQIVAVYSQTSKAGATHIASWDPDAAVAVADLLTAVAPSSDVAVVDAALAVARAYLEETP